jgi:hypothetical protein
MRAAVCSILGAAICACGSAAGGSASGSSPPQDDAGSPDGGYGESPAPDGGSGTVAAVDPWKELFIVDSSVVLDARTSNATSGAWSFRQQMERLGPGVQAESWLRTFRQGSLNGFPLEDRADVEDLIASWPRRDGALDLAQAPFRLLAIVCRIDLTTSANGEARLVYGLYDPATGAPRKMTVGFEYRLPPLGTVNDRGEWARRWHALGKLAHGEEFNAALQRLTDAFAHGASLSQLRTNEQQFGQFWQLRQWVLDGGTLRLAPTPQTPDQSLNGTERLARFILDNADALRAGTALVPAELQGGESHSIGAWVFKNEPRIDEPLRHAFARQTCNGCHAQETNSVQGFFHVSPFKPLAGSGQDRVSDFLKREEMKRRIAWFQELLR